MSYNIVDGELSWRMAEVPLVKQLNQRGIFTDFFNGNTLTSFNTKATNPYYYRMDIQISHPYRILLDAKYTETPHRLSKEHAGIDDPLDCLRISSKNIIQYRDDSKIYRAETWLGIRTFAPYQAGDYFVPVNIFKIGDKKNIYGSICKSYDEKYYLFNKTRCYTFDEFEKYIKADRFSQSEMMDELHERFWDPNWFRDN